MKKRTKKTISVAVKVFTRLLVATILCAILFVSMQTISIGVFGEEVGYRIIELDDDGGAHYVPELEYRYKDGEDVSVRANLKLKDNQQAEAIKETAPSTQNAINIVSQILMLILLAIFPYHILWQFGNRDDTNVRYRGQRPDPLRGFKIGLLAMVPYAVLWVVLLVAKFVGINGFYQVYSLVNMPFIQYNTWVLGAFDAWESVAVWRVFAILPTLLYIPAVCAISYRMGGRQFSITEFLTFTKKSEETEEEI